MGNNLTLYPNIDKEWRKRIGTCFSKIEASYSGNNASYELTCREDGSGFGRNINIVDDSGQWSIDSHNIEIYGKLKIEKPNILFEKDGIVDKDTVLGVALLWKSRMSCMRGSMQIGTLTSDCCDSFFEFRKAFKAATLRGIVEISAQLFVIKPSRKSELLTYGLMLGELDLVTFILEGIGSTFAVFEKSIPGDPLWEVECDWDDPETDMFSDCVKVTINNAHPAWIACSEEDTRRELLKEIMASSMQIVISKCVSEGYALSDDYEHGSVCDAVGYLTSRAGIDLESEASIAKSIRSYLDKSMK